MRVSFVACLPPRCSASSSSQYVTTRDNHKIYTVHTGAQPRLILLHDFLTDHRLFSHLVPHLSPCISYDQRGYGRTKPCLEEYSRLDDIEDIANHFGISTFDLLGMGVGATIALQYAVQRPQCVRSVAVVNATLPGIKWKYEEMIQLKEEHDLKKKFVMQSKGWREGLRGRGREVLIEMYKDYSGWHLGGEEMVKEEFFEGVPLSESVKELKVPVCALWGEGVREEYKQVVDLLGGGSAVDGGYFCVLENGEGVAQVFNQFWSQVQPLHVNV